MKAAGTLASGYLVPLGLPKGFFGLSESLLDTFATLSPVCVGISLSNGAIVRGLPQPFDSSLRRRESRVLGCGRLRIGIIEIERIVGHVQRHTVTGGRLTLTRFVESGATLTLSFPHLFHRRLVRFISKPRLPLLSHSVCAILSLLGLDSSPFRAFALGLLSLDIPFGV